MPMTTLKVLASLLQLHGPGATVQSDHQGINALLNGPNGPELNSEEGIVSDQAAADDQPSFTQVYFRRAFGRGPYGGRFRRAYGGPGAFRRAFGRAY
jgi:hypothetical protein